MRARLSWLLVGVVGLLLAQPPARAQGFNQVGFNTFTTAVTITTTTENVVVSSPAVALVRPAGEVCILGYAQFTTGANTTHVIARIRRGSEITGTLVGEENNISIAAAAGGTENVFTMACEVRTNVESVIYSLTMDQVAATGDGSAIVGAILVLVR